MWNKAKYKAELSNHIFIVLDCDNSDKSLGLDLNRWNTSLPKAFLLINSIFCFQKQSIDIFLKFLIT